VPKLVPVTVTLVAIGPEVGESELIPGETVNATALLALPLTVTTTFPVVAVAGTVAVMLVAVHAVTAAATPLNVTVLAP
jgi:hypothetical protein